MQRLLIGGDGPFEEKAIAALESALTVRTRDALEGALTVFTREAVPRDVYAARLLGERADNLD